MKIFPAVGQDREVKDSLTATKRKADDSQVAVAGASSDEKAETAGSSDVKAPEIKWVEMSLEYIAWLLSQKREREDNRSSSTITTDDNGYKQGELILDIMADDEAGKEEFFAFQDWVRETFGRNGCVMVPEDFNGPNPRGIQDLIDEVWEKGRHELEMIDGCPPFNREEDTAVALPSSN